MGDPDPPLIFQGNPTKRPVAGAGTMLTKLSMIRMPFGRKCSEMARHTGKTRVRTHHVRPDGLNLAAAKYLTASSVIPGPKLYIILSSTSLLSGL